MAPTIEPTLQAMRNPKAHTDQHAGGSDESALNHKDAHD